MASLADNHTPIVDGTLLIEENTLLPGRTPNDTQPIGNGWTRITNNLALERKLAAAGWTFFFMAGTIQATVFGFDRDLLIVTAVRRLLARVAPQRCNCLEIDQIVMRSFCGIPSVTVMAHSRHIQQARAFCTAGALPG